MLGALGAILLLSCAAHAAPRAPAAGNGFIQAELEKDSVFVGQGVRLRLTLPEVCRDTELPLMARGVRVDRRGETARPKGRAARLSPVEQLFTRTYVLRPSVAGTAVIEPMFVRCEDGRGNAWQGSMFRMELTVSERSPRRWRGPEDRGSGSSATPREGGNPRELDSLRRQVADLSRTVSDLRGKPEPDPEAISDGPVPLLRNDAAAPPKRQAELSALPAAKLAPFTAAGGQPAPRKVPISVILSSGLGFILLGAMVVLWARDRDRAAETAVSPAPAAPAPAPAAVTPVSAAPTRVGKYEVRAKIGQGGMGVVYEGFDAALGRKVAIKQMRREIQSVPRERRRFLQEARAVARITHPYIVGIHEIVTEGPEIYLVFDYVEGQPLSDILEARGRLPLSECRTVLEQVCQALDCAHRARILHRDLKPSNIMVDANGFAKVMDFGISREAKDTASRLTGTGTEVIGTPAYMAPEQHLGEASRASDVYSLGVCLYEMLTGELPFKGPDFLVQKERRKYPPPSQLTPGLPKEVDVLLAALLEPDPKKRVADALEFLSSLKSVTDLPPA